MAYAPPVRSVGLRVPDPSVRRLAAPSPLPPSRWSWPLRAAQVWRPVGPPAPLAPRASTAAPACFHTTEPVQRWAPLPSFERAGDHARWLFISYLAVSTYLQSSSSWMSSSRAVSRARTSSRSRASSPSPSPSCPCSCNPEQKTKKAGLECFFWANAVSLAFLSLSAPLDVHAPAV